MSYDLKGKVYRNMQEQVLENAKDIEELQTDNTTNKEDIEELQADNTTNKGNISNLKNVENFEKDLYYYKITFKVNRGTIGVPLYEIYEFYTKSLFKPDIITSYTGYDIIFNLLHRGMVGYNVTSNYTVPSLICITGVNNQYITINKLDNQSATSFTQDYLSDISVVEQKNNII